MTTGMWNYWKDKHGIKIALKDYYQELMDKDPVLNQAYTQLISAEFIIDSKMKELEEEF